jgi:hypothetical protein
MSDVTILLLTSSATTLGAQCASYQNIFSPLPVNDEEFFDEGPRIARNKTYVTSSLSGSIDTSAIDAFAQGVEITNQARYDAGLVKIWSGEPGHRLLVTDYGERRQFFFGQAFTEVDVFDPLKYIQGTESPLVLLPYLLGDEDQTTDYNFNGVIEAFSIRQLKSYEDHDVHGSLVGGNTNRYGSEQVLTVDGYPYSQHSNSYVDTSVICEYEQPLAATPFVDIRLVRNVLPVDNPETNDMIAALSLMTGSTDNYIAFNQRSSTCGWDYDNNMVVGTDSLTFGGMTY